MEGKSTHSSHLIGVLWLFLTLSQICTWQEYFHLHTACQSSFWKHQAITFAGRNDAMCCDCCQIWFHRTCHSMTESHYNNLGDHSWKCCRCRTRLTDTFRSYELSDSDLRGNTSYVSRSQSVSDLSRSQSVSDPSPIVTSQRDRLSSKDSLPSPTTFNPGLHSTPQSPDRPATGAPLANQHIAYQYGII